MADGINGTIFSSNTMQQSDFSITAADTTSIMPGSAFGLTGYGLRPEEPLLQGDRASPAAVAAEYSAADRKPLQSVDTKTVNALYSNRTGDLLNQAFDNDEVPGVETIYATSGSVAQNKVGGLLKEGGASLAGPSAALPSNIGNPRVGSQGVLGSIGGGGTPADAEESLRKQILEAIKTDPATRLDQGVAIPELYQQVNPVAKLGFPVMQTRPQFSEDFVRGRLQLPESLKIDQKEAIMAPQNAYSHVSTLNDLKTIYAGAYNSAPPAIPQTMFGVQTSKEGGGESRPLPGFTDMYPSLDDPSASRGPAASRNPLAPNQYVPPPAAGTMPPLMVGGEDTTVPDSFANSAPGADASKWPINTTGYAIAGATSQKDSGFFASTQAAISSAMQEEADALSALFT
jgi:hypothetical protein